MGRGRGAGLRAAPMVPPGGARVRLGYAGRAPGAMCLTWQGRRRVAAIARGRLPGGRRVAEGRRGDGGSAPGDGGSAPGAR